MPDAPVTFRQLLGAHAPSATEHSAETLLDGMFAAIEPPAARPYTVVNFITSADGRATIQDKSGGLGDAGDKALFLGLRERADAVLAGPETMRKENYGRILGLDERRRRRLERGQSAEPLAVMLTRSGNVPTEIPLFAEPEARVVVFGEQRLRPELDACPAQVELAALDPSELTLTAALARLRADYGVRTVLCEGGPTVFSALLAEGLADELFLTLAPKLAGGGHGPSITNGPELAEPRTAVPEWVLERAGSLFVRYRLAE